MLQSYLHGIVSDKILLLPNKQRCKKLAECYCNFKRMYSSLLFQSLELVRVFNAFERSVGYLMLATQRLHLFNQNDSKLVILQNNTIKNVNNSFLFYCLHFDVFL